jgi:Ca2+-binding RTX toxin-like protein
LNRYRTAALVAALTAAAALPQTGGAQETSVGGLAGNVNLAIADVSTGGVAITSPATASVTATVDPNTVGTQYYFEYGTNGNLTLRTPTVSLGASLDPRQVTANLLGLEPGTLYDYRIVASGPGGLLSIGPTQSFQTSASSARKGSKSKCTIRGTAKSDVLRGTRKRDVICGYGGRDKIRGLGGNDVIRGGAGNDRVSAGNGRDKVSGNSGNDALFGQGGADRLYGNKGRDRLVGGKGRDRVIGGKGRDRARVDSRDKVRSVEKATRR